MPVNSHGYYPARGDDTLLARAIYAESLSNPEDFEAIGWAVANRVGAKEHGRTLDAVLHKPNQYEFLEVGGGPKGDSKKWNETADPTKLTGANLSGWNRALAVASGILSGKTPDVTGGATYFISSDKYVRGRPVTATQGFFRTALTSGRLVDAPYLTTSARKTKNHFYIEMPPPPLPPKAGK